MRRRYLLPGIALAAVAACADLGIAPGHAPPTDLYAQQFEAYWYNFQRYYPYFEYKQVDWQAAYARYRPLVDEVQNEEQLVTLLQAMVTPLRDVHVWFESPQGRHFDTYMPPRAQLPNWSWQGINRHVTDLHYYGDQKRWGYGYADGLPYIYVAIWDESDFRDDSFGAVLNLFRNSPGLILDVRMNGGGYDWPVYRVAGRFATRNAVAEYYRFRDGPGAGDLSAPVARWLHPRGTWQFTRPVALLIGPGAFSSDESFIAIMHTLPNVRTFGELTGGGSGCPREFHLGGGWSYTVPTCFNTTVDGQPIEWRGLEPDVTVPVNQTLIANGDDPVLAKAVAWLKQSAAAH